MASLDPRELEILGILWEHGPQKPAEIQARLSEPIKNAALRWQLAALVERGQVSREKRGKAFYYSARLPQQRVFRSLTRHLANVFSGGSTVSLIGRMLDSADDLSDEDLAELRRIARRNARGKEK